jgi:hypothetical protein
MSLATDLTPRMKPILKLELDLSQRQPASFADRNSRRSEMRAGTTTTCWPARRAAVDRPRIVCVEVTTPSNIAIDSGTAQTLQSARVVPLVP